MKTGYDVYLYFSKAFDTVSYNISINKLTKYRLDKWKLKWIKNWLYKQAWRVVTSGTNSC